MTEWLAATFLDRRVLRHATTALCVGVGLIASPVCAQVMDISPDGTVRVRGGSGASRWTVVKATGNGVAERVQTNSIPQAAVTNVTVDNSAIIPPQYAEAVEMAAGASNISPTLLSALIWQESRWNPRAVSRKGAIGLTQLMPGTARDLGVNPMDPLANLVGGARYLRLLLDRFDGDVERALAAYNAGPGRVSRAGGVPAIAETQNYVASIVRRVATTTTGGQQ